MLTIKYQVEYSDAYTPEWKTVGNWYKTGCLDKLWDTIDEAEVCARNVIDCKKGYNSYSPYATSKVLSLSAPKVRIVKISTIIQKKVLDYDPISAPITAPKSLPEGKGEESVGPYYGI